MTQPRKVKRPTRKQIACAEADMIRRHTVQLSEHFTSVQIFVTKLDTDGTTRAFGFGSGDLLARVKNAEVWAEEMDHSFRYGQM